MPKVSVILPVYNSEKYISEAIESILNQTFEDLEFIIINEVNSPTQTIEKYANQDNRIKIIQKYENKGLAYSLNIGLLAAKGEYIARMDADDISLLDRLEKQVSFMEKNPQVDICGGNISYMPEDSTIILPKSSNMPIGNDDIKAMLLFGSAFAHPTVLIKAESFKKYGAKYSVNCVAEDYELWTRYANVMNYANLPDVVLKYRVHMESLSFNPKMGQSTREISQQALLAIGVCLDKAEKEFLICDEIQFGYFQQVLLIYKLRAKIKKACAGRQYCSLQAIDRQLKKYVVMRRSKFVGWFLGVSGYYKRKLMEK